MTECRGHVTRVCPKEVEHFEYNLSQEQIITGAKIQRESGKRKRKQYPFVGASYLPPSVDMWCVFVDVYAYVLIHRAPSAHT